jgi:hypothetical protein
LIRQEQRSANGKKPWKISGGKQREKGKRREKREGRREKKKEKKEKCSHIEPLVRGCKEREVILKM